MDQDNISIEQFNKLLNQWTGKNIKITKRETGDYDVALLELESVTYEKDTRRIDGYEPMHVLQLNGLGKIENDGDDFVPLPSLVYEIPLEDSTHYQFGGNYFSLTTERGMYTIELVD